MISIPSAPPAGPAVTKSPQPSSAAPVSSDDPNSFASYLKSVESHQSEEQSGPTSTAPKLSMGAKDKADKDPKKNEDDKKKASLTDTVPTPLTMTPASDPRSFQLTWSLAKGNLKAGAQGSGQSNGTETDASEQDLKSGALTGSLTDAITNAPVAFGANLASLNEAKAEGPRMNGSKATDAKAQDAKSSEGGAKTPASVADSGKVVGEASKPAGSKNSSGNQEHSSESSHDDPPASGTAVKAATASASTAAESLATVHAATAPSLNQVSTAASTVQNAYAPPPHAGSVEKAAPAAPIAAVTEPAPITSLKPQNIDLKIAGADNSQVDVRVSQRAGDVQVTVRTPDGDLAQSLRQHLPELSDRLSQAGVSGDLWRPQLAQSANTGGNDADSRYSDDAQTQQQGQQQHSRNNSNHQSQQQETETPQPGWLAELNQAEKEPK